MGCGVRVSISCSKIYLNEKTIIPTIKLFKGRYVVCVTFEIDIIV